MNPLLLKFGGALTLGAAIFLSGWIVKGWKDDSQYKKSYVQAVAAVKAQDLDNQKMGQQYGKTIEVYRAQMDELNGKIQEEIHANPNYGTCSIPPTGVQLINSAVSSANKVKSPL